MSIAFTGELNGRRSRMPTVMAPIVLAGSVGTVIEWYDCLIDRTAVAIVFNPLFIPKLDPLSGHARIARDVCGRHFRASRWRCSLRTLWRPHWPKGVACDDHARSGARNLCGGQWGDASLMVIKHAPSRWRGLYRSLVQFGFPLGLVTSYGVFNLAASVIVPNAFWCGAGESPSSRVWCCSPFAGMCASDCLKRHCSRTSSAAAGYPPTIRRA
jgi:hypothetical protein